jgi:hypothetical protein
MVVNSRTLGRSDLSPTPARRAVSIHQRSRQTIRSRRTPPVHRLAVRSDKLKRDCHNRDIRSRPLRNPYSLSRHQIAPHLAGDTRATIHLTLPVICAGRAPTAAHSKPDSGAPTLRGRPALQAANHLPDSESPAAAVHSQSGDVFATCRGLLGCSLRAGGNQRIVRGVAGTTRSGSLGWEDGRVPVAAAIGNEQHLIVTALRYTARGITVRADDSHRSRRCRETGGAGWSSWPWWSGFALCTRGSGRSRITLRALRPFSTARQADG